MINDYELQRLTAAAGATDTINRHATTVNPD